MLNVLEMTRQMAKEILLKGGKVTHKSLSSKYLEYDNGIKTAEGKYFSCEFYNDKNLKIGWKEHG